jgi:hypothetical protein
MEVEAQGDFLKIEARRGVTRIFWVEADDVE